MEKIVLRTRKYKRRHKKWLDYKKLEEAGQIEAPQQEENETDE